MVIKREVKSDFLIIGGGIIGLTIALELRKKYPKESITIIDKESELYKHSSGRNSGVIHAGFYYTSDSLKAKLTRQGNLMMTEYCEKKEIPIVKCGKLIVAKNEKELNQFDVLLSRAKDNDVPLNAISKKQAQEIQPFIKTFDHALWSPSTSVINPKDVMNNLTFDALRNNIIIIKNCEFDDSKHKADFIINCAGMYSDKIAKKFGYSEDYDILPFKGLYLYLNQNLPVKTNIYPVPNLTNPFLGVHFTITSQKNIKIGPTAIPCFWREQYSGLNNFSLSETYEIIKTSSKLLSNNFTDYSKLFIEELKKYNKRKILSEAQEFLEYPLDMNNIQWGIPGIRAQLVNNKTKKLEMDFKVEGDKKSIHILNAVSPGFTCSFSFAKYICETYV